LLSEAKALVYQFESVFREKLKGIDTRLIEKDQFVELESREVYDEFWPQGYVYISTVQFAKQERISESFSQANWDLVVFDEATFSPIMQSRRSDFIREVIGGHAKKIVFLERYSPFSTSERMKEAFGDEFESIEFTLDSLVDWNGSPFAKNLRPEWIDISFQHSAAEVTFVESLRNVARQLDDLFQPRVSTEKLLLRRASSSFFTLEQTLSEQRSRIRRIRNEIAHGTGDGFDELDSYPELENEQRKAQFLAKNEIVRQAIDDALADFEELEIDSKAVVLVELLQSLTKKKVCILSSYAATAEYLQTTIESLPGVNAACLTANVEKHEFHSVLESFRGGEINVLIATEAVLKGVDLQIDSVINYDLPSSREAMYVRLTRFRPSSQYPVSFYTLIEQNPIDPETNESIQLVKEIQNER
ncbi:helicase-related protein, partial [Mariniblastus sp.]|nr:helicase-related protein [Mariniblastus sp.]